MVYVLSRGERFAAVPDRDWPEAVMWIALGESRRDRRRLRRCIRTLGFGLFAADCESCARAAVELGLRPADPTPLLRRLGAPCALTRLRELGIPAEEASVALLAPFDTPEVTAAARALAAKVKTVVPLIPGGGLTAAVLRRECGIAAADLPCGALARRCQVTLAFGPGETFGSAVCLFGPGEGIVLGASGRELPVPVAAALVRQGLLHPEALTVLRTL